MRDDSADRNPTDLVVLLVLTALALGSRLYGLGQAPLTGDEIIPVDGGGEEKGGE